MEAAVVAAMITGGVAIVGPIITYYATKRYEQRTDTACELLGSRRALYGKASYLVEHARVSIIDTTWGPDAPQLTPDEETARDAYLNARRAAVKKGVQYRELFSDGPLKRERMECSAKEAQNTEYKVRKIAGLPRKKPIIDFMVVDSEHVILSHVRSENSAQFRFLYTRSQALAQLLTTWFEDCWNESEKVAEVIK